MQYNDIPWKDVLVHTRDFTVFRDKYPTQGHILFVPKEETWDKLEKCYKAPYAWGYDWTPNGYCDAYNIGQNIGTEAGQTVMYPRTFDSQDAKAIWKIQRWCKRCNSEKQKYNPPRRFKTIRFVYGRRLCVMFRRCK